MDKIFIVNPNWKPCYIERHMQELLEKLDPGLYDHTQYQNLFTLAEPYVKQLYLRELQQEKKAPYEDEIQKEYINHINFSIILKYFKFVTVLDLIFGPRKVGINFNFNLYYLSVQDCKNLAIGINSMPLLQKFRLHHSSLEDEHLKVLIQSLVKNNNTLIEIDFSHCHIRNRGALYLAELIRTHPKLETMLLRNNLITEEGVKG